MESEYAIRCVEEIVAINSFLGSPGEMATELQLFGLTLADLKSRNDLLLELGIARNIRRACDALGIPISPHQSLTLAKHMRVSANQYRNGVPLSDHERSIALRLFRIEFQTYCRKKGVPFTSVEERDCERMVQFRERGLTIGHKIGEASGCFHVLLIIVFSATSLLALISIA